MSGIIDSNPEILGGKPIIKGTRISVEFLLKLLHARVPLKQILEDYPSLNYETLSQFLQLTHLFQTKAIEIDLGYYNEQVQNIQ
jgi:uncharacterized protein (DUF433 family)